MTDQISRIDQISKIQRFSKVVVILIKIAQIATVIAIVLSTLVWISELLPLASQTILKDDGMTINAPVLFEFGKTKVILPVADLSDTPYGGFVLNINDMIEAVVTLVALGFARRIFSLLRKDGNPFRAEVAHGFKRLAIGLLLVGAVTGAVGFIGAAIVWVLYLIFDYGCALKQESDTTL
jgi:hypothetical protein